MGFLSCFQPLLPARSSARSACSSAESLLEKDARDFIEPSHRPAEAVPNRVDTSARLRGLREELQRAGVDAYIVPTADAHNSEWVGPCDQRRAWLSGFTGSAGVAVVTASEAHLFTDSRYYVQAGKELDANWVLDKVGEKDVKNWDQWVLDMPKGSKIGIDATQLDYGTGKALRNKANDAGLELVFPGENLVDKIWQDRPSRSHEPIKVHPLKFAGKSAADKLSDIRSYLRTSHTAAASSYAPAPSPSFLLTTLNPIAWLLNLRGSDIPNDPVFYAYLLVPLDGDVRLWVQSEAVTPGLREATKEIGGKIEPYEEALEALGGVQGKVVADAKISWAVVDRVGEDNLAIVKSPVEAAQAIKNETELAGFRAAYLRDGAAWVRWQAWLEEQLARGRTVTEWDAGEELTRYREKQDNFAGLAYENISATGENAALPHYEPSESHPVPISLSSPYLNDSGAQYLDGTIDTTRTMHFGRPTGEHRRAYTRVLQGHMAVDRLVFPEGTTGEQVDALARAPLWSEGMNYGHGTGHGVGEYLSVHETQVGISHSLGYFNTPFVPGHITSNEPAYYEQGSYGIRIESVLAVVEARTRRQFGSARWLRFERLTVVPIQTRMVEWGLLSREERKWLEEHNRTCRDKLLPLVQDDKRAVRWLKKL
ncbi:hypothetical protein Rhopal_005524-T1 [Rhodotorula paludigena]|uniref:Creatinase/aminopeptidase n=1 Tax=Rhodotorula paludigena TaxID=86838 RepID=A0AAV5GTC6_9BASI|nr:hypothetical protein Rhopal_005524-T1 [Rhodotorula paludigena]